MSETDREHVPWGSCEKNFENIVIRTWPRCSSMDIVCGYGKIVTGTDMHDCLTSVWCVCTTWCIFLCMQTGARCIIQGLTQCSHAPVWRMRLVRYCIGHYTQFAAVRVNTTSYDDCVDAYTLCLYVFTNCILWMQHVNVLPVLKHGPRSLMCVQVRNRDHSMRNKRNYIHAVICCRQICLNEFEHEHAH